jgi:Rrf2 family transcriptional regulator, iron-sulfur cluster assembly transcription factor
MLSQASGYAAIALGHVANAAGLPILVKDMAAECAIPAAYLSKIIHTLARKGLVNTQRGIGGGVTLNQPASAISLYDLCVALDDPVTQPKCMLGVAECTDERACPAHLFWKSHRLCQVDFLKKTSIADIADFTKRGQKVSFK